MKITQEHVGKWVRIQSWSPEAKVQIKYIGSRIFLGVTQSGDEDIWPLSDNWALVEEKQFMAPAICRDGRGYRVTDLLFENEREAISAFPNQFYSWPALVDKETGMYIVPKKENI